MSLDDPLHMDEALRLAAQAYGQTSPNPLVGAVVTRGARVLGTAWHARAGEPHAESQALALARAHPDAGPGTARDWTLHVNLEPCVHTGRTPPCVDAVLASPVGRVSVALVDPDPRVAGRGVEALRRAGVRVDVGCRAEAAHELNHVFFGRTLRRRPFVALKVALSADGCTAAADGGPTAISDEAARRHTHRVRAGLDAILIGVETLGRDRPRLDRRLYPGPAGSEPRRIVLDPDLRSDPAWLWPGEVRPLVVCETRAREARGARYDEVADLVCLPVGPDGFRLEELPGALAARGLHSLLVEGGGSTHRHFFTAGLWDRFYLYRNPKLRLDGRVWEAAASWERARERAGAPRHEWVGGTELEVTDAPGLRGPGS